VGRRALVHSGARQRKTIEIKYRKLYLILSVLLEIAAQVGKAGGVVIREGDIQPGCRAAVQNGGDENAE